MEIAGAGSQAWDPADPKSGELQTRRGRFVSASASPAAPTRCSATSSATACWACPANISVDTTVPFKDLKVGTAR